MALATNKTYFWLILLIFTACKKKNDSGSHSSLFVHDANEIVVPKDSTKLMQSIGLLYYRDQPFSGVSIVHHSNGNIIESNSYKLGKRDGMFKKWFANGMLSFESRYLKGKRNGQTKSWWSNGNLRSKSNFVNGVAQGVQMQWYQSGAKFKQITVVDGKEKGIQKSWRENGKIYNNYEAKDERIYGLKKAALCFQLKDEQLKPGN